VAQEVEHFLTKHKNLGLIISPEKKIIK
jgi:hypothetical protein